MAPRGSEPDHLEVKPLFLLLLLALSGQQGYQRLNEGELVFHYAAPQEPIARQLAVAVREHPPLPALPADILGRTGPIDVYLAGGEAAWDSLTGGRAPEWGAGLAFPRAGVVVLPAYESRRGPTRSLPQVLRHELAHVALERYLEPHPIPRWFHEGYARWAAGEWDWEAGWMLRIAFATGRAPALDSLSLDWPGGAVPARVAYLLSASAVEYLDRRGGEFALRRFLERWREHGDMDAALRETYGRTFSQFEADWSRDLRRRYGWAVFLSHTLVFWAGAAMLLLILVVIRKRRDRQRLDVLRQNEVPERPAYWLGEEVWEGESGEGPRPLDPPSGHP